MKHKDFDVKILKKIIAMLNGCTKTIIMLNACKKSCFLMEGRSV